MHTTSTRPDRRRALHAEQKLAYLNRPKLFQGRREPKLATLPASEPQRHYDPSIYTGNVLQEIARQQAAGNAKFSGRAFALKAWRGGYR